MSPAKTRQNGRPSRVNTDAWEPAGMWLRVSTTMQDSENQRPAIERYCDEHAYQIRETYQLDGASAFHGKQEKLLEDALADVRSGKIKVLVAWGLDRVDRQGIESTLSLIRRFREAGGRIESVKEPFLSTDGPVSEIMGSLLAFVAHQESVRKAERQEMTQENRRQDGKPPNNIAYGYKNDEDGHRIPDGIPDESARFAPASSRKDLNALIADGILKADKPAAIIIEIFVRYAAGEGPSILAADFTRRGIPTMRPGNATSDDPLWRADAIRRVLLRPVYAAIPAYKGEPLTDVTAEWPALISQELYWSVRLRAATQRDEYGKQYRDGKGPYLMASTVRCDGCGGRLERAPTYRKDGHYVTPAGERKVKRVRNGSCYACHNLLCPAKVSVKQEQLDEYVLDQMALWLAREDVQEALASVADSAERSDALALVAKLKKDQTDNARDYTNNVIPASLAGPKAQRLELEIKEAEERARKAGLPSVLGGITDDKDEDGKVKVAGALKFARMPVPQQRVIIRKVADIRIRYIGKGHNNGSWQDMPIKDRVSWRWLIGPGASELPPLPARMTQTPRERIRAALLSEPSFRQLNHAGISMKLNVAPDTVRFACESLVADGTLSECTHRLTPDGKLRGQRLTVKGGLIWTALLDRPELSPLSHAVIAARLGVTPNNVGRACLALVRDGALSKCAHILNEDGTVDNRSHAVSRKWKAEAETEQSAVPEPSKQPDYTLARRREVSRLLAEGYSQQRIAAKYGVSRAAIQRDVQWCREHAEELNA